MPNDAQRPTEPNGEAPKGHVFMFGAPFKPAGWQREPILVLQTQLGWFTTALAASLARERMPYSLAKSLQLVLVKTEAATEIH